MVLWTIFSVLLCGHHSFAQHRLYPRVTNSTLTTSSQESSSSSSVTSTSWTSSSGSGSLGTTASPSSASSSGTTTSTNSSVTITGACTPSCGALHGQTNYIWMSQAIFTHITAAKVIYIFNKQTNTTRTVTSYYDLPSGFTLPPTNAAGTHTTKISIETLSGQKMEVELAYPTQLRASAPLYYWWGTLPTVDAMGKSVCSTYAASELYDGVTVPAHNPLLPIKSASKTDSEDPYGFVYSLNAQVCIGPPAETNFPGDAAPKFCTAIGPCPAMALSTAKYLTETETSTEDGPPPADATPTDSAAARKPDSKPPTDATAERTRPPASADVAGNIVQALNPLPTPEVGATPANGPQATATTETQQGTAPAVEVSPPAPAIVVGSSTIVANSESVFVIAGQSLSVGGGAVTVDGNTVSLAGEGASVVVNGEAQAVQTVALTVSALALSIDGQIIAADSNSAFVVAGQTLSPGSSIVVAGTTISLAQGAGVAVINGVTQNLTPAPTSQALTINGQIITADSNSAFVIAGQPLTPGGSLVVSGTTIALNSGGAAAINGVTQLLTPVPTLQALTLNGQTITANSNSEFVIAGQTLTPGGTLVVSGTTIVLNSGGTAVVNGVTQILKPSASAPLALTINSQTITANSASGFVISGQTLGLGHPITIGSGPSAATLSLITDSAGHTVLISNGKSSTISSSRGTNKTSSTSSATTTSTTGVGDIIASGIGMPPGGTHGTGAAKSTSSADATRFGINEIDGMTMITIMLGLGLAIAFLAR